MQTIEIIKPDDFHVHFRDGEILKSVVPETSRNFNRAIVMPNLIPPILSGKDAIEYKKRIESAIPREDQFVPLMTIYLNENTDKNDLREAFNTGVIVGAKLYPAGATTNSDLGVKNISNIIPVLEIMSEIGMPLLIHGEVTDEKIDIFDREKVFIDTVLYFICKNFPNLKITLEHITTDYAVQFIESSKQNIAATITPHHLALNRNALFVGGIRPHYFCLPVLKREKHRLALIEAAISGKKQFFLGTDSAPHKLSDKETNCGCAGVFNSTYSLSTVIEIFYLHNSMDNLEKFLSINGARHYNLPINSDKIIFKRNDNPIEFKKNIKVGFDDIILFNPGFPVYWEHIY